MPQSRPLINARIEKLAAGSWTGPFSTSGCIVRARGFYERIGDKGSKQPWYIHWPGWQLLGFAGTYSWWPDRTRNDDGPQPWMLTATIVTSDAVQTLAGIHNRSV